MHAEQFSKRLTFDPEEVARAEYSYQPACSCHDLIVASLTALAQHTVYVVGIISISNL